MSTSTSKRVGSKAREAFIEKNMDPKLYQRQKEVAEEFIREMKQRGYSLQTGDFRQALRDAGIRSRWIREQIAKGKLELALKEEAIRMDEAEALDYAKSITAMEEEIAAWEVKQEDALDEDAKLIKESIKERPRLAAKVLKDRTVEQMVEKGLREFKKGLAFYEQRFDELEGIFQRTAMAKVDAMKLPDKLHQRAAKFEDLIAVTIAERDTLFDNLAEAHRQLDEAKQEAVIKDTEHANAIQARKSQVGTVVKQNAKLQRELSAAKNQVESRDGDVESLGRQVEDLQATKNSLQGAAHQASNDIFKLGKEKEDLAKEVAALKLRMDQNNRDHAAAIRVAEDKLSKARIDHDTAINTVRGELATARSDHAVAIAAVKSDLSKSQGSFKDLQDENTEMQLDSLDKLKLIENLEAQLQSCKADLNKAHQESQDKINSLNSILRSRGETLRQERQEHDTAIDKLSKEKANVEQELASCQVAAATLGSDLQSRDEILDRQRQDHSAAIHRISEEKGSVQQELISCQNTVRNLESDLQSRNQALDQQSQAHSAAVDRLSQEKASIQGELQSSRDALHDLTEQHRTALDERSKEKSKLESDWQARYATLEKLKKEREKELSDLSKAKSQMETEAKSRSNDLAKSLQDSRSEINRMTSQLDGLKIRHQASRNLIWAATSDAVPVETVDGLVDLLSQFLSQHGEKIGSIEPFGRRMPRMVFDHDGPENTPMLHAINFNAAMHKGTVSFQDSQALFNAPIIAVDNLAYPFVLEGLQVGVAKLKDLGWPVDPINFSVILTMIQGIAYLGYLVQFMQIPSTDVESLGAEMGAYVSRRFQGSILESVFNQSLPALAGQEITTWLGDSTSVDPNARMDQTNSAIGAGRCIVGDTASLQNFVLLDKIGEDEVLYAFGKEEIKAVAMVYQGIQLMLHEGVIPTQVHGPMMLTAGDDSLPEHLGLWLALFSLLDRLGPL
ncbi:MAG: hypothetical protein Q9204_000663 [Flavoplaca sp. TL-2023a]